MRDRPAASSFCLLPSAFDSEPVEPVPVAIAFEVAGLFFARPGLLGLTLVVVLDVVAAAGRGRAGVAGVVGAHPAHLDDDLVADAAVFEEALLLFGQLEHLAGA